MGVGKKDVTRASQGRGMFMCWPVQIVDYVAVACLVDLHIM